MTLASQGQDSLTEGARAAPEAPGLTTPTVSPSNVGELLPERPAAWSSSARRLAVGVGLLCGSAVSYALLEGGADAERIRYLALSLAGVSLISAVHEILSLLIQPDRFSNPLSLLPASGVVLIAGGALGAALTGQGALGAAVTAGPALAAAGLLLLRFFVARNCSRSDDTNSLLFRSRGDLPRVKPGDSLTLQSGQVAPADARISAGSCAVCERYLSTDTHFRVKDEGDVVFAGSEIVGGTAQAIALSGSEDSCLRSIERLIENNVELAGSSLHREDGRSQRATAYVLMFVSVTTAILWDERTGGIWESSAAAGLVLFASIVCQLSELLYARQRRMVRSWARNGFVAMSDATLRDIARTSRVLIDPSRVDLGACVKIRELEILDDRVGRTELAHCLSALLGRAEDPALAAAGDFCQQVAGSVAPDRVLNLQETAERGIRGSVKGVPVTIGSEDLLVEQGVLIPPSESAVEAAVDERALLVAIGGELVARIWVKFGQLHLLSHTAEGEAWPSGITAAASRGTQGEVVEGVMLVRGQESDLLGRAAAIQISLFSGDRFELPRASLVALTPHLEALPAIIAQCQRHLRIVERSRILIAFGTFLGVSAAFLGIFSPLVALGALGAVSLSLFLF